MTMRGSKSMSFAKWMIFYCDTERLWFLSGRLFEEVLIYFPISPPLITDQESQYKNSNKKCRNIGDHLTSQGV